MSKNQAASRLHQKNAFHIFGETTESLIMAFVLAFVFRAFVVEAFVIPTGSMADTLRGAHFPLTCPKCACRYNFGFTPESYINPRSGAPYPKGYIPPYPLKTTPNRFRQRNNHPTCPFCGVSVNDNPYWVSNGDRILVLKYIYQFVEPKIWDVIVFKNPTNPSENYIKRLIGTPGDTVEIIDGDVYINNIIQRKPPHIQDTLWITAFDNDYQPDDSHARSCWKQPLIPENHSSWQIDPQNHRYIFSGSDKPQHLNFEKNRLREIIGFCAYNGPQIHNHFDLPSDIKLAFTLTTQSREGKISISLGKYNRNYRADIEFNGNCTIFDEHNQKTVAQHRFPPFQTDRPLRVSFANVDHSLQICLDDLEPLTYLGPNDPAQWGYESGKKVHLPSVSLSGQGKDTFTLSHIALYRDIHYTNHNNSSAAHGTEGYPITLRKYEDGCDDEFFVMGDNSPHSFDSRFWDTPGLGNNKTYREGTVPRDYLIGKAFFVYWPSAYRLPFQQRFPLVPNFGDMRFIK